MIVSTFSFRVRYVETDQMGFVYYGHYPTYFEIGRVELFRDIGLAYSELEASGVLMPVLSLTVNYKKPALYDECLTVKTSVPVYPSAAKIIFNYEIIGKNHDLKTTGETVLFFMDKSSKRPIRCPEILLEKIKPYFLV